LKEDLFIEDDIVTHNAHGTTNETKTPDLLYMTKCQRDGNEGDEFYLTQQHRHVPLNNNKLLY
jgi:hypothetical protein